MVDGEIVVPRGDRLDFEALLQRIHPAESRVNLLAEQTPASFVAFDLLALGDESLLETPFAERQARLERGRWPASAAAGARHRDHPGAGDGPALVPRPSRAPGSTASSPRPADLPYGPDKRLMTKVKHVRTADCVVAGFRWHKSGPIVGSLLLGLYDDAGELQHIGVARLVPDGAAGRAGRGAGALPGPTRWTTTRGRAGPNAQTGRRRRAPDARARSAGGTPARTCPGCRCGPSWSSRSSTTSWRAGGCGTPGSSCAGGPDRDPRSCTYDQLDVPVRYDLAEVLDTAATGDRRRVAASGRGRASYPRRSCVSSRGLLAALLGLLLAALRAAPRSRHGDGVAPAAAVVQQRGVVAPPRSSRSTGPTAPTGSSRRWSPACRAADRTLTYRVRPDGGADQLRATRAGPRCRCSWSGSSCQGRRPDRLAGDQPRRAGRLRRPTPRSAWR